MASPCDGRRKERPANASPSVTGCAPTQYRQPAPAADRRVIATSKYSTSTTLPAVPTPRSPSIARATARNSPSVTAPEFSPPAPPALRNIGRAFPRCTTGRSADARPAPDRDSPSSVEPSRNSSQHSRQAFLKPLAPSREPRHHRADRHSRNARNLLVRQFFQFAQDDYFAEFERQPFQAVVQRPERRL